MPTFLSRSPMPKAYKKALNLSVFEGLNALSNRYYRQKRQNGQNTIGYLKKRVWKLRQNNDKINQNPTEYNFCPSRSGKHEPPRIISILSESCEEALNRVFRREKPSPNELHRDDSLLFYGGELVTVSSNDGRAQTLRQTDAEAVGKSDTPLRLQGGDGLPEGSIHVAPLYYPRLCERLNHSFGYALSTPAFRDIEHFAEVHHMGEARSISVKKVSGDYRPARFVIEIGEHSA